MFWYRGGKSSVGKVDVLVGGTPCQSFSLAGVGNKNARKGMDDFRGQLAGEYAKILGLVKPKWFVWENVCGVFSVNKGKDFARFLGEVEGAGYSLAWRVLDGRDFKTPQPRRRVFVVGHIGDDWRPPAGVLFEQEGYRWYEKESGKERLEEETTIAKRTLLARFNTQQLGAMTLIKVNGGVRRLSALECERYMGFPDNYTDIFYRGKKALDTHRCKALGNSIIPAKLKWIGERIMLWEEVWGRG